MEITFTADPALLDRARRAAEERGTTLDAEFERWLAQWTDATVQAEREERLNSAAGSVTPVRSVDHLTRLFADLDAHTFGQRWTREERNAR